MFAERLHRPFFPLFFVALILQVGALIHDHDAPREQMGLAYACFQGPLGKSRFEMGITKRSINALVSFPLLSFYSLPSSTSSHSASLLSSSLRSRRARSSFTLSPHANLREGDVRGHQVPIPVPLCPPFTPCLLLTQQGHRATRSSWPEY
eukprot:3931877-Rhodomonas_salina.2